MEACLQRKETERNSETSPRVKLYHADIHSQANQTSSVARVNEREEQEGREARM